MKRCEVTIAKYKATVVRYKVLITKSRCNCESRLRKIDATERYIVIYEKDAIARYKVVTVRHKVAIKF